MYIVFEDSGAGIYVKQEATCIKESTYSDALTRGKKYEIIEINHGTMQIRIRGDNDRIRWYPLYCFDLENKPVPKLMFFSVEDIDDVLKNPTDAWTEVNIRLTTEDLRWCWFGTPSALARTGDIISDADVRFHYGNKHTIISNKLSYEIIEYILKQMDAQNELLDCTLPFEWNTETNV